MKNDQLLRASALASLVACGLTLAVQQTSAAVPASPVGPIWDCIISGGGQQGLAFLTFADDGTFNGFEVLSARRVSSTSSNPRGPFTDTGRTFESGNTNRVGTTNLFGFAAISGPWSYDERGRLLGSFTVTVDRGESAEESAIHALSFTGTVVPERRLTLVGSTPHGRVTYSAVPYRETPDYGGSWYGTKIRNKQALLEYFGLTSLMNNNPFGDVYPEISNFPGIYYTEDTQGAGYSSRGFVMISPRKKIGFALLSTPLDSTNSVLSATYGSYSVRGGVLKASTTGLEEPSTPITFKAVLQPQ